MPACAFSKAATKVRPGETARLLAVLERAIAERGELIKKTLTDRSLRSRGLSSPDLTDALSMTFAVRVADPYRPVISEPRQYTPGMENQRWMM